MVNCKKSKAGDGGFSVLELLIAVSLYAVGLGLASLGLVRGVDNSQLVSTRDALLWRMRFAQTLAYQKDEFTSVNMDKYSPTYQLYEGWTVLGRYAFASGIQYRGGYLQMQSGRVFYGVMGDSHEGGTVRLVDAEGDERSIVLYLTSGLQVKGEMSRDTP